MKLPSTILKSAVRRPGQAMFCTQCGTANTRDSKYCKECGESLVTAYAPKSSPDPFVQAGLGREEQLQRLLDMAFWHNEAGNTAASLLACQAALALNDRCSTAWSLMGCLYEKKGELERAVEAFEVVCALNPESMADAQKLESLRRGIHVKAVPQPAAYRWVPPALARAVQDKPSAPAIGAAAAAIVVLTLGILAMRPLLSAQPRALAATDLNLAASRSAWATGDPASGGRASLAQDIASPSAHSAPAARPVMVASASPAPIAPSTVAHDPFVSAPPPITLPVETVSSHASSEQATLPPLAVKSLPDAGQVRPLPIPAANEGEIPGVSASAAPVPEHTVLVTVPPDPDAPAAGSSASGADGGAIPGDNGAPPPAPRISITVHGMPDGNAAAGGDDAAQVPADTGPMRHLVLGADSGASLQQKALTYQQQGDYTHAQAAYTKAIAAYQAELNSGQDSDAAVRGIQACETGLQICRQSQ